MKFFIAGIMFSAVAWAQLPSAPGSFTLTGEVSAADRAQLSCFLVELYNLQTHAVLDRVQARSNGDFQFSNVTPGMYAVRVIEEPNQQPVVEQYHSITSTSSPLMLRISTNSEAKPVSGTVSLHQLQHPVPKQALRAFEEARKDKKHAIEKLEEAIRIAPDYYAAHASLGVEYLHASRYAEAAGQFRAALEPGSPNPALYVNLACANFLMRDYPAGEEAARKALALDPKNSRVHYLLGTVLSMRPGKEPEALEHLQAAAEQTPKARLLAAQLRVRLGDIPSARRDLTDYLNSGAQENRAKVESWLAQLPQDAP
jgi:tetratricopeptide (TPR) repeat protein